MSDFPNFYFIFKFTFFKFYLQVWLSKKVKCSKHFRVMMETAVV